MANISKANLQDKDIRNLQPKASQYRKAVGNPKELYIWVNPSGIKTFFILHNGKTRKLGKFKQGVYGVEQAREEALKISKRLKSGADIRSNKYKLGTLFERYIKRKQANLSVGYTKKIVDQMKTYILPKFENIDIATIKFGDLLEVLDPLFNPHNPKQSRLETIHRIINHLNAIFELAINDRYIDYNPCKALHEKFPTSNRFSIKNGIDTRYAAIIHEADLKEFFTDLRDDDKMDLQTKRAVMLQILCVNRPGNTASVKWEHIDLENGIWNIPATQMKMRYAHKIALSKEALKILNEQKLYCPIKSEFVFPAVTITGHMSRDGIGKAIRNLGGKGKYLDKASAHGFRATFKTICTLNLAQLGILGISNKTVENALAHKELNNVRFAYERQTATIEQNRILMQWYSNYLNNIVKFI
jgi:bacteriophage P4-like integrase